MKNLLRFGFRVALVFSLFSGNLLHAQTENQILDDDIHTVQLSLLGSQLSLPVVDLKAGKGALRLQFDHMGDEFMDYKYTLVHCNSDWQPSDLNYSEYVDGFTDDRITSISNSFNTNSIYTHYTLSLPNNNIKWTKSGNYLLKVYDYYKDELVLVRRFVVVERLWGIEASFVRTAISDKKDTWHEIDFTIHLQGMRITLPQKEVKALVLQNGRWDNAIGPLPPYLNLIDKLSYDYHDKIVFPAGKEFRFFDMRTFQVRGEGVKIITEKPDYYEVTLKTDDSRFEHQINYRIDANGRFIIQNLDKNLDRNSSFNLQAIELGDLLTLSAAQDSLNRECDYASVLFSIRQNLPIEDADVYVFGELTDWQLKPEFKMEYSSEAQMYYCSAFLKQGYYNYEYVVLDHRTGQVDIDGLEGNWYETGNNYTILTYFRPFGERYDRLLGTATLESTRP